MKRIYHNCKKWEDIENGMYKPFPIEKAKKIIRQCRILLSNEKKLYEAMKQVTRIWIFSTEVNLTNKACNRQAWLGQSACCLMFKAPDHLTKEAWHQLSIKQQTKANAVADKVDLEWCKKHLRGLKKDA